MGVEMAYVGVVEILVGLSNNMGVFKWHKAKKVNANP